MNLKCVEIVIGEMTQWLRGCKSESQPWLMARSCLELQCWRSLTSQLAHAHA